MIEKEAYLRCNYSEGMFSNEYFINFNGCFEREAGIGGEYLVMKENIIQDNNSLGLVKIAIAKYCDKNSNILIKGLKDVGAGAFFTVPNEEIVFR